MFTGQEVNLNCIHGCRVLSRQHGSRRGARRCPYELERILSLIPGIWLKRGNGAKCQKFRQTEGEKDLNLWKKLGPNLINEVLTLGNFQSLEEG